MAKSIFELAIALALATSIGCFRPENMTDVMMEPKVLELSHHVAEEAKESKSGPYEEVKLFEYKQGLGSITKDRATKVEIVEIDGSKVKIETIKRGDEVTFPKTGDKVTCNYVLSLTNGRNLGSSAGNGKPFKITVGGYEVFRGWDEGIKKLSLGQKAKLTIPAALGYGSRAVFTGSQVIPADSVLVLTIELLSVS